MNELTNLTARSAPDPSKSLIFLVDDDPQVLTNWSRLLKRAGYPVEPYSNPREALKALPGREVTVLLTDKDMPEMDGIELATRCLEVDPDLAVIMLTGFGDVDSAAEALRLGIQDYLQKPPELKDLEAAVQRAIWRRAMKIHSREMEKWYRAEVEARTKEVALQKEQLEDISIGALAALTRALEAKNPHFRGHSEAVAELSAKIAAGFGHSEEDIEKVRVAGLLHDIGMIAVQDAIIEKEGPLTDEEFARLREHCRIGEDILRPFSHLGGLVDYVLRHHERLDGSGYPDGLTGKEIPLGAQILGIAESFVALTQERAFRPSLSPKEALETLWGTEGMWFSRRMLEALEAALMR